MKRTLLIAMLAACGGDDDPNVDPDAAGPIDAPPGIVDAPVGQLAITSTAFSEGTAIPSEHTCDGANTSPALAWSGAPGGTQSFAIVLTDRANDLRHSAIYDIPASATGLPADVDTDFAPADVAGAHQARNFAGGFGYRGPCPPVQQGAHTYEFALYALDVATLPGVDMNTTAEEAETVILAHDLAKATLTGTYDRN